MLTASEDIADEIFSSPAPIFVSLGSACDVASAMRMFELRFASFPLDWLLFLDTENVIRLLDDDFSFFLDERYFGRHQYHPYVIVNQYYDFEFRHDWLQGKFDFFADFSRYKGAFPEIKKKYERRINRFRKLGQHNGIVYFIRAAIDFDAEPAIADWATKNQRQVDKEVSIKLRNSLRKYFPFLNFKLIVINYIDEVPKPVDFEGEKDVIEFKFNREKKYKLFGEMFESLLSES